MRSNRRKTKEEFIEDSRRVHGDKYDYSQVDYISGHVNIIILCPEHNIFTQTPANHLSGKGCPSCGKIKSNLGKKLAHKNKRNWNFEQPEDHKLIPLTQGKFAMVDNDDFDRVKDINWTYSQGYALNNKLGSMHRYIMGHPDGYLIDHKNHNTLDNRKTNIRYATKQQNQMNQRIQKKLKTSMYKGVSWDNEKEKWVSVIKKNYKGVHLGRYEKEEEAAKAYDRKALELFGEFAYLNFPEMKQEYLKQNK